MNVRVLLAVAAAIGLWVGVTGCAFADDRNQKTVFTFSGPVEVPASLRLERMCSNSRIRNPTGTSCRYCAGEKHLYCNAPRDSRSAPSSGRQADRHFRGNA